MNEKTNGPFSQIYAELKEEGENYPLLAMNGLWVNDSEGRWTARWCPLRHQSRRTWPGSSLLIRYAKAGYIHQKPMMVWAHEL
jgi:hypothetical protein